MADFLIADTHFGDSRIIRLENRPFKSAEEMDKSLIKNWNTVVNGMDTVFTVGDFTAYTDKQKVSDIVRSLKGNKVLIMGNHDDIFTIDEWREIGFGLVIPYSIIVRKFFILSHKPLYINMNGAFANVYGHVHGNPSYKDVSPISACVSAERINYTPISFDSIINKMKEAENE